MVINSLICPCISQILCCRALLVTFVRPTRTRINIMIILSCGLLNVLNVCTCVCAGSPRHRLHPFPKHLGNIDVPMSKRHVERRLTPYALQSDAPASASPRPAPDIAVRRLLSVHCGCLNGGAEL